MRLSILVDNYSKSPFAKAWGLSILVEVGGKRILWDTGPDPSVLRRNASLLRENLEVDLLAFSHRHWDHTGGAEAVKAKRIIAPRDSRFPIRGIEFNEDFTEVLEGVYLTRPMSCCGMPEQALVIRSENGTWVMLVGCSHPGVDKMYSEVLKELGIKPEIVIGGFHLFGEPKRVVESVIANLRNMGAKVLHPIHCSGDYAKLLARSSIETGSVLEVP